MKTTLQKPEHISYRALQPDEILRLQHQDCTAEDWALIKVHPDFNPDFIRHTRFIGHNMLGKFEKNISIDDAFCLHSGIDGATLRECRIGDNCLIYHNTGYLSNYHIGNDCILIDTGILRAGSNASFGQGCTLSVLSETGGRDLVIHDRLSTQEAYLEVFYRHDPTLIQCLQEMARSYAATSTLSWGTIGAECKISRCGLIEDVKIGTACHIDGAASLINGTICSETDAPTVIGEGVICKDFIIQSGCHISDNCMLTRSYVGQASIIAHGFTATDSFISCNCQFENGEACAIFAGPYTVSHHKSTLLIGGYYSFFNAGSGSNQSNHMYKLGPSHQGILERGCKTASDSYILWPLRAGAFSFITGHHTVHADASSFPFSYLIAEGHDTWLVPGVTIRNVGTARDIRKWPQRDKRTGTFKLDYITFDAFSPYTIAKMQEGLRKLLQLQNESKNTENNILMLNGLRLTRKAMSKGIAYYRMAIDCLAGRLLTGLIEKEGTDKALQHIAGIQQAPNMLWADVGGLLTTRKALNHILSQIKQRQISTPEALHTAFSELAESYHQYTLNWLTEYLYHTLSVPSSQTLSDRCQTALQRYKTAHARITALILEDAAKEFATESQVGFGIDNPDDATNDFLAVRGCPEAHPFLKALREEAMLTANRIDRLITHLNH